MADRPVNEPTRHDRLRSYSVIPPEVQARMERRAEQFQRATNRKGLPVTWGVGKEPRKKVARKG